MYKFDLRPAYDPNLMPHLQTASEIEERFIQQVWSLHKSETTSLLLGIAQKISVAADILRERNEAVELAVPAIRNALLFHLVDPILDDLLKFLEILSTPEKQWRLAYMK